ncbi:MAG: hypothetical protein LC104_01010 [Bacteroidales bacterium]|nr:hypothetical protein [Bacteroidales bacterium]
MITCPCCRATNTAGPACRRCKADLSLLFDAEQHRAQLMHTACQAWKSGDLSAAHAAALAADQLRHGSDARQLLAVIALRNRDFPAAWAWYSAVSPTPPRREGV